MGNFTPWNQHPRSCVLEVGRDYDQTLEGDRHKASMAAILANVWIFNARAKARKNVPMGVFVDEGIEVIKKSLEGGPGIQDFKKAAPMFGVVGTCIICEQKGRGSLVQFVDKIRHIETEPVFYCAQCFTKKMIQ